MEELISKLIELQKVDNRLAELNAALSNIPEYLKKAKDFAESTESKYSELKENLEKVRAEKEELEKGYAERKQLLEKAQGKLSTVKNNKEYEAVLKELDLLKKQISDDEERLVILTEEFEKLSNEYSKADEEIKSANDSYKEKVEQKESDDSNMQKEEDELKVKRDEIASGIKKSVLSKYERVRKARHNLAIVRVFNEVCSGCNMKIPPQLYVEVKKNNDLYQCPNCQRYLYYRDED